MSKKILAVAAIGSLGLSLVAHADTQVTENTTVGGRGFIDITNIDASKYNSSGVSTKDAANGIGADVTRFYLIADHTFDSMWSANLTTDFNYVSNSSKVAVDGSGNVTQTGYTGETQIFIKKAYLQAKFGDGLFVRAGAADTTWIPFDEATYGYRYVEKVIVDKLGYGTSSDWGLHAGGKLAGGTFGYAASLVEGNGYKNPTRSKSLDVEGRVNWSPVKDLVLAAGFYSGKLGKDVEGATTPTHHTYSRFDALAAYTISQVKFGAEYFSADDKGVTNTTSDKADGFSVFANWQFNPQAAAFVRYDDSSVQANTLVTTKAKEQYYNVGVACKVRKGVELAAAYKHDEVKTGGAKTSDRDEVGVWAQVSF